jgi:photosystem II stability/assembly factor-like uncharacterized protein
MAIPDSLAVTAPASAEAGSELQFGSAASGLSGLTFAWDFGDGKTSSEASPKHSYAKGGDYEVVLKVSNTAGASREQRVSVSVTNLANVKGLICSGAANTGWCWQQPRPTGNTRNDLAVINSSTAISIGDNGEIFRTTDAGTTWTPVASGVSTALRAVAFSSDKDGWIIGDYGALLRSSDGGASWSLSKIADSNYYSGVSLLRALDANKALYGDSYDLRYTLDGGATWNTSTQPTVITPKGVFWTLGYDHKLTKSTDFGRSTTTLLSVTEPNYSVSNSTLSVVDESQIIIITVYYRYESNSSQTTYKLVLRSSADGGNSWTRMEPTGFETESLRYSYAPRFLRASSSDKILIASLGYQIYRSNDGGASWQKTGAPQVSYSGAYDNTLDAGNGVLLVPSYASLYRSEDLGQTWATVSVPGVQSNSLSGLKRIDASTLLVRATDGSAYLSGDQGKTWKPLLGANASSLASYAGMAFLSSKRGLLLSQQGELSETTDGGLSWTTRLAGLSTGTGDLQFYGDKLGWMLLADGRWSKSSDGGATWGPAMRVGSYGFRRIGLVDDKRGWAAYYYSASSFALTADSGQTWTDVTTPSAIHALFLGVDQVLLGYGYSGVIAVSSDGGKTWNQRFSGTQESLMAMAAQDANTLWVVGGQGVVRRSDDKGQTWKEVSLGTTAGLRAIAFASGKVGWIVGERGTIYATQDGGKTWQLQPSGTQRVLTRIVVVDAKTAWIMGDNGSLLATGSGGF